jgi:hypothetical protein
VPRAALPWTSGRGLETRIGERSYGHFKRLSVIAQFLLGSLHDLRNPRTAAGQEFDIEQSHCVQRRAVSLHVRTSETWPNDRLSVRGETQRFVHFSRQDRPVIEQLGQSFAFALFERCQEVLAGDVAARSRLRDQVLNGAGDLLNAELLFSRND